MVLALLRRFAVVAAAAAAAAWADVFPHRSWCQGDPEIVSTCGRAASRPTQLERSPSATRPWHVREASARLAVLRCWARRSWPDGPRWLASRSFFCLTSDDSEKVCLDGPKKKVADLGFVLFGYCVSEILSRSDGNLVQNVCYSDFKRGP